MVNADTRPSVEELREKMKDKINSIPSPKLSKKRITQIRRKNENKDKENLDHTIKILAERRKEAERDGDSKKKFASIAYERDQKDRFNIRNQLRKLKENFENMKKTIPKEDLQILENFSELKDPNYWKKAKEKADFDEQEIAFYYRDLWGISPKNVVKFRNLMKLQKKIQQTEDLYKR